VAAVETGATVQKVAVAGGSAEAVRTQDLRKVLRGLREGEVMLGTGLAEATGLGVGDQVTLATRQGPRHVRVAGTVTEYSTGGMALYLEWAQARSLLDVQGVDVFLVAAKPGQADVLGTALGEFTGRQGLLLQSLADLRGFIQQQIDGVVGALWLLVALIFVVAALGIANTLSMSVLEQTRELGLLRAVAMTRRQVRRLIVSQALAIVVIALPPGLIVGMAMGWLLQRGSNIVSGQPVVYQIQPAVVVGSVVVAVVFSVLAAYLPARRAANLGVIQALQYE
jgi:putative ABC transport system permease protein